MLRKIIFSFFCSCCIISNAFCQSSHPVNYSDSTRTVAASNYYKAHLFWRVFFGNHYRSSWTAPVFVHYLDLEHLKGGLTPKKMGGGFQTKSLHLKGADGIGYVIRTIDKNPSTVIDSFFRKTFVNTVVHDQISASHPYGFLIVPRLAEAAGIYHTHPQLFYVPDDSALGKFREDFKGRLVLFEEREFTDSMVAPSLRGFNKVISAEDLNDTLIGNSDNQVDERFTLRSRLVDMLIGDFDRHETNWQWARFDAGDGQAIFRPIPVDRDQAFFSFDGFVPWFARMGLPKIRKMQFYRPMTANVKWFNYNARYFDQNYLSGLSHDDWQQIADSLVAQITDAVIDSAVSELPDTIYNLNGKDLTEKLKGRRDNLPEIAERYYHYRTKKVLINGTNSADYFEVIRLPDALTEVNVYQMKDGKKGRRTFHRVFTKDDTKEIRLHGYGGDDMFEISGSAKAGSLVRIIDAVGNNNITMAPDMKRGDKKIKVNTTIVEKEYKAVFNKPVK